METFVLNAVKEGNATISGIKGYLFYNYEIETPVKNIIKALENLKTKKLIKELERINDHRIFKAIKKRKAV